MKQLRQKFGPIRKTLERGDQQYLLMYRSKPLAVIRPYAAETDAQHLRDTEIAENPTQPLNKLPDPKTISLSEETQQVHADSDTTSSPLEKLGMRRALV